jgi:hypothetical protein
MHPFSTSPVWPQVVLREAEGVFDHTIHVGTQPLALAELKVNTKPGLRRLKGKRKGEPEAPPELEEAGALRRALPRFDHLFFWGWGTTYVFGGGGCIGS